MAGTVHSAGLNVSTLGTIANLIVSGTVGLAGGGGTVTNLTVSGTAGFAGGGGTVSTLYVSGTVGIVSGYGTLDRLLATAGTATNLTVTGTAGIAGGMGSFTGIQATNGTVSGVVRADYIENTGGTAYGVLTGLGTTFKVIAGTGVLSGGSLGISTNLLRIYGVSAMPIRGNVPDMAAAALALGTVKLSATWQADGMSTGAGTACLWASDGAAISGTCPVSWLVVGV